MQMQIDFENKGSPFLETKFLHSIQSSKLRKRKDYLDKLLEERRSLDSHEILSINSSFCIQKVYSIIISITKGKTIEQLKSEEYKTIENYSIIQKLYISILNNDIVSVSLYICTLSMYIIDNWNTKRDLINSLLLISCPLKLNELLSKMFILFNDRNIHYLLCFLIYNLIDIDRENFCNSLKEKSCYRKVKQLSKKGKIEFDLLKAVNI